MTLYPPWRRAGPRPWEEFVATLKEEGQMERKGFLLDLQETGLVNLDHIVNATFDKVMNAWVVTDTLA